MLGVAITGMMVYGSVKGTATSRSGVSDSLTQVFETPIVKVENQVFFGEKGTALAPENGFVSILASEVSDGQMHYYNYFSQKAAKTVYFFIIQASDGTYRAAANACEVCFGEKKGFYQDGEQIVCKNCQQVFPKERIGIEKGGCNPAPISSDVSVEVGQLLIGVSALDETAYLF
ncbi:DUF2318 domain-containing protein [Patescibacteria group bacterium]|nr:DUF2318 domain-containing protein [Patescibacteria group bacterium]